MIDQSTEIRLKKVKVAFINDVLRIFKCRT